MKEILKTRPSETLNSLQPIVSDWKATAWKSWKNKSLAERKRLINILLLDLSAAAKDLGLVSAPLAIYPSSDNDYYVPKENSIHLNARSASVITALHEFGHYLLGSSELEACRFSVWIFKETFPQDFRRLRIDGHMLKLH